VPVTDIVRFAVAAIATCVLIWAAVSDVRTRRIPNASVLALLGLFVAWTLADGGVTLASALEAGGLALAVSGGLYLFKILGAGDSKLFTVCALFAGMAYLPYLALATSLAGGVIALASLASRPRRALVMLTMRGKGHWGGGVPYGLAVAAGAAIVIWAPLTGALDPFAYFGRAPVTEHALARALHDRIERQ